MVHVLKIYLTHYMHPLFMRDRKFYRSSNFTCTMTIAFLTMEEYYTKEQEVTTKLSLFTTREHSRHSYIFFVLLSFTFRFGMRRGRALGLSLDREPSKFRICVY